MQKVSVLMLGTGGYGRFYLRALLNSPKADCFQIIGAVDLYAEKSEFFEELCSRKIPVYHTIEEFYLSHTAELAIIATPIYLHAQQAIYCMEHGSDVLCEKPICACPKDAEEMISIRNKTGRKLAIGFQWSFSKGILRLKQDILDGRYGQIQKIRTIVYFPRNLDYYQRGTKWAGKRRLTSGEWVLDSVASNAAAHYLHNMLFLTGNQLDRSAEPIHMTAEIYKVNNIEMFDTCALRVYTLGGIELMLYATHAVPMDQNRNPEFVIEGEYGTVTLRQTVVGEQLTGHLNSGETILYEAPSANNMRKLYCMSDAIRNGKSLPCVAETAVPHLKCVWALSQSYDETPKFPDSLVQFSEEANQYTCAGLAEVLEDCYQAGKLPYEKGIPWAVKPHDIWFD